MIQRRTGTGDKMLGTARKHGEFHYSEKEGTESSTHVMLTTIWIGFMRSLNPFTPVEKHFDGAFVLKS